MSSEQIQLPPRDWRVNIIAEFNGMSPYNVFKTFLIEYATTRNQIIYSETTHGYVDKDLSSFVRNYPGVKLVFASNDPNADNLDVYSFHGEKGIVQALYSENHIEVTIMSVLKDLATEFTSAIKERLSDAPMRGTVHMLALEQNYYLTQLGEVDHQLERGNYTPEILSQYDRVVEDLSSDTPTGRLTILDGEPGTGKSFLIRGILSAVRALFIYIPASVAGRITGPDIIPVLMREKDKNVPIILLMEDADSSLATRQLDNVARLSDLLNMSDGILGDMSDLRIIATTNSQKAEIDKAVMRSGRMNEHLQLKFLEADHSLNIFTRLCGTKEGYPSFPPKTVLADVYREARNHGWKPMIATKKKRRLYSGLSPYDY